MKTKNVTKLVLSIDEIDIEDTAKIRVTVEPIELENDNQKVLATDDLDDESGLYKIVKQSDWKFFKKRNGSWVFSDQEKVRPLRKAIKDSGGKLRLGNRVYKITGEDGKFISRYPA